MKLDRNSGRLLRLIYHERLRLWALCPDELRAIARLAAAGYINERGEVNVRRAKRLWRREAALGTITFLPELAQAVLLGAAAGALLALLILLLVALIVHASEPLLGR